LGDNRRITFVVISVPDQLRKVLKLVHDDQVIVQKFFRVVFYKLLFAEEPDDGNFAGISAERGSSDKKQVFDGFFKLIEFMIGKGERAEEWTNQWSECRSKLRDPVSRGKAVAAPSENPKDDLQAIACMMQGSFAPSG